MNPRFIRQPVFTVSISIFLISAFLAAGSGQESSGPAGSKILSAMDTLRINQVSSPHLSPDGQWVVYTLSKRDMQDKDYKSTTHIWIVKTDGAVSRQMTRGEESCTSPAWFPDGRSIVFLSSRGKARTGKDDDTRESRTQVFMMPVDGGEAWQLFEHKENVQAFRISPDSTKIAFTARDSLTEDEKERQEKKDDAVVVDEKFRMSHLWVFDIASKKSSRLTEGAFSVGDFRWSPDSKSIAFVSRPNPKVDVSWDSDIWVVTLKEGTPKKLFENPGPDTSPRWSPDGKTIAFAAHPNAYNSTWYSKLHLIPAAGGGARVLLEDFDLDFGNPIWSPDGKTIF
jgi:Tol biopolymer transport system component